MWLNQLPASDTKRERIGCFSENILEVSEKQNDTGKGVHFMVGELGKKYENLSHSIAVWQIDCRDKKFRFLSLVHYSKEGKAIYSWKVLYPSLL